MRRFFSHRNVMSLILRHLTVTRLQNSYTLFVTDFLPLYSNEGGFLATVTPLQPFLHLNKKRLQQLQKTLVIKFNLYIYIILVTGFLGDILRETFKDAGKPCNRVTVCLNSLIISKLTVTNTV